MIISTKLIQEAICNLECGQMIFLQNLSNLLITEYMYYFLYISVYVSHMPSDIIETTIVPVIRINVVIFKTVTISYPLPIAIATIVFKLYESTIQYKCEDFLKTWDNQFGFKRKHSTAFCIYTLKEVIDYYNIVILPFLLHA